MTVYISEYTSIKFKQHYQNIDNEREAIAKKIFWWVQKRFSLSSLENFLRWCNGDIAKHQRLLRYVAHLESKYRKQKNHDIFSVFFIYFDWSVDEWNPDDISDSKKKIIQDPYLLLDDTIFNTYKYEGVIDFMWPILSKSVGDVTFETYAISHASRMLKQASQQTPHIFKKALENWKTNYMVPFALVCPFGCHIVDYYRAADNADEYKELISNILYELSSLDTSDGANGIAVSQAFCDFALAFEWDVPLVWTSWIRDMTSNEQNSYLMTTSSGGVLLEAYFKHRPQTLEIYYQGQGWRPSEMLHFLKTGKPPETITPMIESPVYL